MTDGAQKYIWFSGTGHEQLFDLTADPAETHDLATDPLRGPDLARWRAQLIGELAGREEGFTDGRALITGRPVQPTLPSYLARVSAS
jgi:hypothetical protein